ncbi:unnamed protein product [Amoebophrya sp. A25]|nr:unnamed protein product [Amoebophrya sp. A25]|eukprot:GSA25T00006940001.1
MFSPIPSDMLMVMMCGSSYPMNQTGTTPASGHKSQAGISRLACFQDSDFVCVSTEKRTWRGGLCSCGPTTISTILPLLFQRVRLSLVHSSISKESKVEKPTIYLILHLRNGFNFITQTTLTLANVASSNSFTRPL